MDFCAGVGLYLNSTATQLASGVIANDSFIRYDSIAELQCVSGSLSPNVGSWIAPDGEDITRAESDQFEIVVGGSDDPGYLSVQVASGVPFTDMEQGVYTCRIPDETGEEQYIHIGLYLPDFDCKLLAILFNHALIIKHTIVLYSF